MSHSNGIAMKICTDSHLLNVIQKTKKKGKERIKNIGYIEYETNLQFLQRYYI